MKIKYVPVLRYIREERKALKSVKISKKILPLLELVNERAAQKRSGSFENTYLTDFSTFNYLFLIDIPIYMNVNSGTRDNVKQFINKFKQNPELKIEYYRRLSANPNIIPIISYDPRAAYSPGAFINDYLELRKDFSKIGFRVFNTRDWPIVIQDIEKVITSDDFFIFDIKNSLQSDIKLKYHITSINKLKSSVGFFSIIIRSVINPDIIFNKMSDGCLVSQADNSMLNEYSNLGFDAFGDYVGIRKDSTISKGGSKTPSPGFIYYSWHINSYYGFKGRKPDYKEFINHIKSNILKSSCWLKYSNTHRINCPGCNSLSLGNSTNSWDWKRYSIQHYLYTMNENL